MLNPTYLIRSRHNVFYFRWPLPPFLHKEGRCNRIKVSLRTCDPKVALRLSKALEYHAHLTISQKCVASMKHEEIISLIKDRFHACVANKPFVLSERKTNEVGPRKRITKPENMLGSVIDAYIVEMTKAEAWEMRTEHERCAAYALLIEILGKERDMSGVDVQDGRRVKETLMQLPSNRGKIRAAKGLSIAEQMKLDVPKLAVGSVNKYLSCYSGLFMWAKKNGYALGNPFEGMALKETKAKKKRDAFTLPQVQQVLSSLKAEKEAYRYWGILIALYTGARLNEISSLTAADVKQEDGIWYFDINDEDEKKRLKTAAATRKVPVHPDLIQRGFLNYVAKVSAMQDKNLRLLYQLTYLPREGWGRKLGRWFNEDFLVEHGLKCKTLTFHSLRHTAITNLRQAGVDNHIVRVLVGHEADGVTEQVYNKGYRLGQLKEAIERLGYSD